MIFILQAVIILLLPLVMNLYFFMLLLALFGTTVGTFVAHFPLLVLRYVDSNLQSVAMGCEGLLSGIAAFAIPMIAGKTLSEVMCFLFNSVYEFHRENKMWASKDKYIQYLLQNPAFESTYSLRNTGRPVQAKLGL